LTSEQFRYIVMAHRRSNTKEKRVRHAHAMPQPGFGPRGGHPLQDWLAMSGQGHGHGRGRGGPRGEGFGGPPWGPGGFGAWGPRGRGGWGGRGPRARRGDVRLALLALLAEEPRNGYALMQEIEQRSEGRWRPSPGSVYPALQQLEDEGLVRADDTAGRRAFSLTEEGRAHVEANEASVAAVWEAVRGDQDDPRFELRSQLGQLGAAVHQVALAGGEAQVAEAKRVLAEARRTLYRLLADEEPAAPEDEGTGTA
jgi:DNA-binding PadR family transcriptional regulator